MAPVTIGVFSETAHKKPVKHVECSEDTSPLVAGDIIEGWGYITQWDDSCVTKDLAESWRQQGDPICDAALDVLFPNSTSSTGVDLLLALESHVASHLEDDDVRVFFAAISQSPLPHLSASETEMRIASDFFLDHAAQISQALMYYSLAGGFASPRIVTILHSASYLVHRTQYTDPTSKYAQAQDDRTYIRLWETYQFVLDVMGCSTSGKHGEGSSYSPSKSHLLPGGEGWRSVVRVRMLHGIARRRARAHFAKIDEPLDFVPVNQEDMSATLAAFSTAPLWCLSRLSLTPTSSNAEAYLALWRHVGFYLGVSPSILAKYFASPQTADKFLASSAIHIFSPPNSSNPPLPPPTLPILRAMSLRPPVRTSFAHNCAAARLLLGPALAAHLGVPRTPLAVYLKLRLALLVQRVPVLFLRYYPRRAWARKRRAMLREGLVMVVRWSLGMRRTAYRPRDLVGEGAAELAEEVKEAERVAGDAMGAKLLGRMMREVWVEMVGVICVLGVAVGVTSWVGARQILSQTH